MEFHRRLTPEPEPESGLLADMPWGLKVFHRPANPACVADIKSALYPEGLGTVQAHDRAHTPQYYVLPALAVK